MSIRPIKRLVKAKPTLEGAGVHLRRAFGFGNTSDFDPFLLLDATISAMTFRTITSPASRGIPTAASKPSPMSSPARSSTATACATTVPLDPATCNG